MAVTTLSCKAIRTDPHHGDVRELYALVQWHTHGENDSTFDISLTDCSHAWCLQGGRPEGALRLREQAWTRARQALSDDPGTAGTSYEYWIDERNGQCKLFWQWSSQGAGKDVLFVTLGPAEADAVIRSIIQHMVASYSYMKTALAVSSAAQVRLEKSLAAKDLALRNELQEGKKREEELFLKFALLQNRQTAENKRLRAELDQYQQELKRLQGENEVDTDDEALAAAYGAAYEADTEDESDDVGGEAATGAAAGAAAAADVGSKMPGADGPKQAAAAHVAISTTTAGQQQPTVSKQEVAAPAGLCAGAVQQQQQQLGAALPGGPEEPFRDGSAGSSRGEPRGLAGLAQKFLLDDESGEGQQRPDTSQHAAANVSDPTAATGAAATGAAAAGAAAAGAADKDENKLPADVDMMDAETQPLDPAVLQQEYLKHQQHQQQEQQQHEHVAVRPELPSRQHQSHEQQWQQGLDPAAAAHPLSADDGEPAAIVSRARRRRR